MCEDGPGRGHLCHTDTVLVSSDFLYKSICYGYSFELHCQVDAIQMGTHYICFYTEETKSTLAVI